MKLDRHKASETKLQRAIGALDILFIEKLHEPNFMFVFCFRVIDCPKQKVFFPMHDYESMIGVFVGFATKKLKLK